MKTTKQNPRDNKTNGKQFSYILDCITVVNYSTEAGDTESDDQSDAAKIAYLIDHFNKEANNDYTKRIYPAISDRIGSWLRGLPSNIAIAFWDDEIENIGKSWGYCQTPAKAARFVKNWFEVIGYRVEQLAKYYNITIN